VGSGNLADPTISDTIHAFYWGGDALYDALQVTLSKKFSHGFQAQGSFTWGKNIDTGSSTGISDPYTNSLTGNFMFCVTCRRGLSDFNVAKNLCMDPAPTAPTTLRPTAPRRVSIDAAPPPAGSAAPDAFIRCSTVQKTLPAAPAHGAG
jgi:hypothetical protein